MTQRLKINDQLFIVNGQPVGSDEFATSGLVIDRVARTITTGHTLVTEFPGVDPTGATDSSTGIVAAESVVGATDEVVFPAGTYLIGSDHTQTRAWKILRGATITVQSGKTLTMAKGVDAGSYQWLAGTGTIAWTHTDPVWANWFPGAEIGAQVSACWAAIDWSASGVGPQRIDFVPSTTQTTPMILTRSRRAPHEQPIVWCHGTIHCQVVESSNGALDGWCVDTTGSFWLELHKFTIVLEQGAGGKYPTGPLVEGRDENNVTAGLVAKSSGGHLIADWNVTGISEFGPVNIGSEGNEYRGGAYIVASANGAGVTNGRTQRVGWYLAGDNFRFQFASADPACVLGNGDVSGAHTTVADLAIVAGSPATITGTGLPTVSPAATITLRGRGNLVNEYRWIIDSVVTPGAQWTAHKEYGDVAESEGALSTNVLVNSLASTTSIEARFSNVKIWCTDVVTGADGAWVWTSSAGNLYVDGFQSVTGYQGELVAGPDVNASHLVIDASRRRASVEWYGYYSHPSATGTHYNNSIRTVGRPSDLAGTAWITTYLADFSGTLTQVDANSAALRYGRTFSTANRLAYGGSLAIAQLQNSRVDGAKWDVHSNQILVAKLQGAEIFGPVAALDIASNGALAAVNGTRLKTAVFDQVYGTSNAVVAYRDLTTGVAMTEGLTHGSDLGSTVGDKEAWTLDFTGLTGVALNSKYFTAEARSTTNGALVSHYFWFNSSGAGVDPAPGGTGHVIVVLDANDATTCANAARLVIAALTTTFTASNVGAVLSLACVVASAVTAPTAGDTTAALSITAVGTDVTLAVASGTSRFQRNLGNSGTYRLGATGATATANQVYEILRTAGGSSVVHVLDDASGVLLTTIPAAFTRALFKFDGTNWAFRDWP